MERRAFLAGGVLFGGALLASTLAGCIPTLENNVSLPPSPRPTADPTPSAAGHLERAHHRRRVDGRSVSVTD